MSDEERQYEASPDEVAHRKGVGPVDHHASRRVHRKDETDADHESEKDCHNASNFVRVIQIDMQSTQAFC